MKSLETGWVGHWGPLPLWWRLWEWIPPAICNGRRDLNTKSIITVRTSYWSRCCYAVQDSAVCLITSCCLSFSYFYFLGYWFQNAYSLRKGQDASNFYVNSRLCFTGICVIYYGELVIQVSRCHWNEVQAAHPFVEMNWNIEIICSYVTSVSNRKLSLHNCMAHFADKLRAAKDVLSAI